MFGLFVCLVWLFWARHIYLGGRTRTYGACCNLQSTHIMTQRARPLDAKKKFSG
jgi:hypothetical protein